MYTAMLTAENVAVGTTHDVWSVNVEQEYHEEARDGDRPSPPASPAPSAPGATGTGRDAPVIPRSAYGPDHPVNQGVEARG